jgi:hypothetical protein
MVQVVALEICLRGVRSIVRGCIRRDVRAGGIYPFDYRPLAPIYFRFYAKI